MLPPARRRGYWRSLVCLAAIALGGGGRDVASEKSRRCHLQQPPGPPPTSTAVFCVYQKPRTLLWGAGGKYHRDTGIAPVRVEGAFPALIDAPTFQRIQDLLRSRAPAVTPPRQTASPHLLSGLLRCGGCGARMFGHLARTRGNSYVYYVCATAYRQGRASCSMRSLPREVIEGAVLRNITSLVLRETNLEELVRLTNEELSASQDEVCKRLAHLEGERRQVEARLEKLYDFLENAKRLDPDDLAPRIKALRQKQSDLFLAEAAARDNLDQGQVQLLDPQQVVDYIEDLGRVLEVGSPKERRELLRSFIHSIVWEEPNVTIEYTLPVPASNIRLTPAEEFVHTGTSGGAGGIRTLDPLHAKQVLSH